MKNIYRNMDLSEETIKLISEARAVTDSVYGRGIYIRGIIEYSNICGKNCRYCGISGCMPGINRYRLSEDEIVSIAENHIKKRYKNCCSPGW